MRYEIFSDGSASLLKLNSMGVSGDMNVTKFGPARRDLYIIHYVTKGKGYYNGNEVNEGEGFLIYPGQDEVYYPSKSNPWEFLWIISSDEAMKEIFERYNADSDTLIFKYDTVPMAKKIGSMIMSENGKISDSLKMLEMFLHILNSHTYTRFSSKRVPDSEIYLNFCTDFIETNMHKKITVEELSRLAGISQPYLHKIFRKRFNMSTKEYITWYKMKKAKELLVETSMSITEIANSVGYSDVLAFSRGFSSRENMSPQKYRQLMKKDGV